LIVQCVARIGTLSCFRARCAKYLICRCYSAARPPRTSWLLSCHRSVGGLLLAVLASPLAKLRSPKIRTERPRGEFRGRFVVVDMPNLWWPRVHHATPSRRKPARGSGACCVCSMQTEGRMTTCRSTRRWCRNSNLMIAAHTIDVQWSAELLQSRRVSSPRPAPCWCRR